MTIFHQGCRTHLSLTNLYGFNLMKQSKWEFIFFLMVIFNNHPNTNVKLRVYISPLTQNWSHLSQRNWILETISNMQFLLNGHSLQETVIDLLSAVENSVEFLVWRWILILLWLYSAHSYQCCVWTDASRNRWWCRLVHTTDSFDN